MVNNFVTRPDLSLKFFCMEAFSVCPGTVPNQLPPSGVCCVPDLTKKKVTHAIKYNFLFEIIIAFFFSLF